MQIVTFSAWYTRISDGFISNQQPIEDLQTVLRMRYYKPYGK